MQGLLTTLSNAPPATLAPASPENVAWQDIWSSSLAAMQKAATTPVATKKAALNAQAAYGGGDVVVKVPQPNLNGGGRSAAEAPNRPRPQQQQQQRQQPGHSNLKSKHSTKTASAYGHARAGPSRVPPTKSASSSRAPTNDKSVAIARAVYNNENAPGNNTAARSHSAKAPDYRQPSAQYRPGVVRPKTQPESKVASSSAAAQPPSSNNPRGPDSPNKIKRQAVAKRKAGKVVGILDDSDNASISSAIQQLSQGRRLSLLKMLEDAEAKLNGSTSVDLSLDTAAEVTAPATAAATTTAIGKGKGKSDPSQLQDDDEYSDFEDDKPDEPVHPPIPQNSARAAPAPSIGLVRPPVPALRPTLERIAHALARREAALKAKGVTKKVNKLRENLGPAALLRKVQMELGLSLSTKEVTLLINHFDPTRNRLLDYKELCELVRSFTRLGNSNVSTDKMVPLTEREEKMAALVEQYKQDPEKLYQKEVKKKMRKEAPIERQSGVAVGVREKKRLGDKHRGLLEMIAVAAQKYSKKIKQQRAPVGAPQQRVLVAQSDFRKRLGSTYNVKVSPSECAIIERHFNMRSDGLVDMKEFEAFFFNIGNTAKTRARKAEMQEQFIRNASSAPASAEAERARDEENGRNEPSRGRQGGEQESGGGDDDDDEEGGDYLDDDFEDHDDDGADMIALDFKAGSGDMNSDFFNGDADNMDDNHSDGSAISDVMEFSTVMEEEEVEDLEVDDDEAEKVARITASRNRIHTVNHSSASDAASDSVKVNGSKRDRSHTVGHSSAAEAILVNERRQDEEELQRAAGAARDRTHTIGHSSAAEAARQNEKSSMEFENEKAEEAARFRVHTVSRSLAEEAVLENERLLEEEEMEKIQERSGKRDRTHTVNHSKIEDALVADKENADASGDDDDEYDDDDDYGSDFSDEDDALP
jgi:hypothetical protein